MPFLFFPLDFISNIRWCIIRHFLEQFFAGEFGIGFSEFLFIGKKDDVGQEVGGMLRLEDLYLEPLIVFPIFLPIHNLDARNTIVLGKITLLIHDCFKIEQAEVRSSASHHRCHDDENRDQLSCLHLPLPMRN
jgi:hypothetical protein